MQAKLAKSADLVCDGGHAVAVLKSKAPEWINTSGALNHQKPLTITRNHKTEPFMTCSQRLTHLSGLLALKPDLFKLIPIFFCRQQRID